MSLFSKRKDLQVRNFVLKLVNNHCPGLTTVLENRRSDSRVNLAVVATIIPMADGQPQIGQAFTAVTKEFSNTGVAVVLDRPPNLHEAVLGFQFDGQTTFIRAQAKHLDPMGGGFFQFGFHLTEIVTPADYPALESAPMP
jgi:hypothetical protein